jgi:hypothetical protein
VHIVLSFLVTTNYILLNPPSPSAMLEQIFFLDHDETVEFVVKGCSQHLDDEIMQAVPTTEAQPQVKASRFRPAQCVLHLCSSDSAFPVALGQEDISHAVWCGCYVLQHTHGLAECLRSR